MQETRPTGTVPQFGHRAEKAVLSNSKEARRISNGEELDFANTGFEPKRRIDDGPNLEDLVSMRKQLTAIGAASRIVLGRTAALVYAESAITRLADRFWDCCYRVALHKI
jgi:hypothetical protein